MHSMTATAARFLACSKLSLVGSSYQNAIVQNLFPCATLCATVRTPIASKMAEINTAAAPSSHLCQPDKKKRQRKVLLQTHKINLIAYQTPCPSSDQYCRAEDRKTAADNAAPHTEQRPSCARMKSYTFRNPP